MEAFDNIFCSLQIFETNETNEAARRSGRVEEPGLDDGLRTEKSTQRLEGQSAADRSKPPRYKPACQVSMVSR
jgi:hypothetical protein